MLGTLVALAGLRGIEETVEEEVLNMPDLIDVYQNRVLGREIKRGEVRILRIQIEKRFGPLPGWAEERIHAASFASLEGWALRILDAGTLKTVLAE